jgi:hypothetical protein
MVKAVERIHSLALAATFSAGNFSLLLDHPSGDMSTGVPSARNCCSLYVSARRLIARCRPRASSLDHPVSSHL